MATPRTDMQKFNSFAELAQYLRKQYQNITLVANKEESDSITQLTLFDASNEEYLTTVTITAEGIYQVKNALISETYKNAEESKINLQEIIDQYKRADGFLDESKKQKTYSAKLVFIQKYEKDNNDFIKDKKLTVATVNLLNSDPMKTEGQNLFQHNQKEIEEIKNEPKTYKEKLNKATITVTQEKKNQDVFYAKLQANNEAVTTFTYTATSNQCTFPGDTPEHLKKIVEQKAKKVSAELQNIYWITHCNKLLSEHKTKNHNTLNVIAKYTGQLINFNETAYNKYEPPFNSASLKKTHENNLKNITEYLSETESTFADEAIEKLKFIYEIDDKTNINLLMSTGSDDSLQFHLFNSEANRKATYLTTTSCQKNNTGHLTYRTEKISTKPSAPTSTSFSLKQAKRYLNAYEIINHFKNSCSENQADSLEKFNHIAYYENNVKEFINCLEDLTTPDAREAILKIHYENLKLQQTYLATHSATDLLQQKINQLQTQENPWQAQPSNDPNFFYLFDSTKNPKTKVGTITTEIINGYTYHKFTKPDNAFVDNAAVNHLIPLATLMTDLKKKEIIENFASQSKVEPKSLQHYQTIFDYTPVATANYNKNLALRHAYLTKYPALPVLKADLAKISGCDDLSKVKTLVTQNEHGQLLLHLFNNTGNNNYLHTITCEVDSDNFVRFSLQKVEPDIHGLHARAEQFDFIDMLSGIEDICRFHIKCKKLRPTEDEISEVDTYDINKFTEKYDEKFPTNSNASFMATLNRKKDQNKTQQSMFVKQHTSLTKLITALSEQGITLTDIEADFSYHETEKKLYIHLYKAGSYTTTICYQKQDNIFQYTNVTEAPAPASTTLNEIADLEELLRQHETITKFEERFPPLPTQENNEQTPVANQPMISTQQDIKELIAYLKNEKAYVQDLSHYPGSYQTILTEKHNANISQAQERLTPANILNFLTNNEIQPEERYKLLTNLHEKSLAIQLPDGCRILKRPAQNTNDLPSYLLLEGDNSALSIREFTEKQCIHHNDDSPDKYDNAIILKRPPKQTLTWTNEHGNTTCLIINDNAAGYSHYQLKADSLAWENGVVDTPPTEHGPTSLSKKIQQHLFNANCKCIARPLSDLLVMLGQADDSLSATDISKLPEFDQNIKIIELKNTKNKQFLLLKKDSSNKFIPDVLIQQTDITSDQENNPKCNIIARGQEEIDKLKLNNFTVEQVDRAFRTSKYLSFSTKELKSGGRSLTYTEQASDRRHTILSAISNRYSYAKSLIREARVLLATCHGENKPTINEGVQKARKIISHLQLQIEKFEKNISEKKNEGEYLQQSALCNELYITKEKMEYLIKHPENFFIENNSVLEQNLSGHDKIKKQINDRTEIDEHESKSGVAYAIGYTIEKKDNKIIKKDIGTISIAEQPRHRFKITATLAEIYDTLKRKNSYLDFSNQLTSAENAKYSIIKEIVNSLGHDREAPPLLIKEADMTKITNALLHIRDSDDPFSDSQLADAENIRKTLTNDPAIKCLFELAWGNDHIAQSLIQYGFNHNLNVKTKKAAVGLLVSPSMFSGFMPVFNQNRGKTIDALNVIKDCHNHLVEDAADRVAGTKQGIQSSFGFSGQPAKESIKAKNPQEETALTTPKP